MRKVQKVQKVRDAGLPALPALPASHREIPMGPGPGPSRERMPGVTPNAVECWPGWHQLRRAEAIAALRAIGIQA
jgi:hypothetical protein